MKGKRLIVSIGLIAMLAFSNYTVSQGIRDNLSKPVVSAFKVSEAELLQVRINARDQISEEYLNENEIKKVGQGLLDKFNIQGELEYENYHQDMLNENKPIYTMDFIEEEDQRKLIISGKDKNNSSVTIILLTYIDKYSNLNKTELIVDITSEKLEEYDKIQSNIKTIFNNMEMNPKINTCIVGTFDGDIENNEKIDIVSEIMARVGAKKVEEYTQPDIISISAYSPNIDNHIYTGNNKMNLNIAMRHNYTEDKTYIWIATPIINEGY